MLGQPQGTWETVDRQQRRKVGDLIILMDEVGLTLIEQTGDDAERLVLRRGQPQFLAQFLEMIGADDGLTRIDVGPGGVLEIEVARDAANARIERVISFGIIGIVARRRGLAVEIGPGIGQVPVADLTFDRHRGLHEPVAAELRRKMLDLQITDTRV